MPNVASVELIAPLPRERAEHRAVCVCVCVWACVCVGGREIDETEEYLQKCIKNSYDVKYSIAQHFRCFRGVSNPTQKLFHELTFFPASTS